MVPAGLIDCWLTTSRTCFFVLGLISSTTQGAELLGDYQWEATLTPLSLPTGLCIPVDIEKFLSLPTWKPIVLPDENNRLIAPTAEVEIEAVTAVQNLANTVIANAASRSLARFVEMLDKVKVLTFLEG